MQHLGPWTYLRRSLRPYGFKPFTDEFLLLKNLNCIKVGITVNNRTKAHPKPKPPNLFLGIRHMPGSSGTYILFMCTDKAPLYTCILTEHLQGRSPHPVAYV